ncbi:alpha/beta hydrolase [Streptomyces cinnamoneus]|uniref:Alpha/beta hydrolase n=2 Tax=Streptomyces cinnamoneus TaxID=53446 RepID=A0A2G1XDA4_STRCJ|nr:alpha/beta hydrolase [Streptomyces cinnamoneus]PPT15200.1 alpha/beta hydrolase [Streptomyces cinnamoneus]
MNRRTLTKSAVLATALLLTGGTGLAPARAATEGGAVVPRLPAPTGPYATGVTALYLVDRSRPDPWEPKIPVREVLVTVFHPARTVRGRPAAPQWTQGAAELFGQLAPQAGHRELPAAGVDWAATATHSRKLAPATGGRRPVLLYSPGGGDPGALGTGLAEDLASHGYVVVVVDHPGDGLAVEFPCGTSGRDTVRATVFRDDPRAHPAMFRTAIDTRIADIRFVLDQLEVLAAGRNPDALGRALPEHLGRALDLRRVGVYGHSAGGTAVAEALYEDRRVGAAVTMEGYLDYAPEGPGRPGELFPVARHGVDRPLLLLGTDGFRSEELDRSWSAVLARSGGRVRRRQLDDSSHWVFTDYAAFAPQLQTAALMTAEGRNKLVGPIDPARSVPAVRGQVRSFFDRHLPARRA